MSWTDDIIRVIDASDSRFKQVEKRLEALEAASGKVTTGRKTCGTCKWYFGEIINQSNPRGKCHRFPPYHPVGGFHWCGEHSPQCPQERPECP